MIQRVDASIAIRPGMAVWPGDGGVVFTRTSSIEDGESCNVTHISLGVHTGTHVDAPSHFVSGASGVDQMDVATLIGPAYVLDVPDADGAVTAVHLTGLPECDRLVLRTANTGRRLLHESAFCENCAHADESAAREIIRRGVRLIGVDYLSVEGFSPGSRAVHDLLLGEGIIVVEGLDLEGVSAGWWRLICLPLKLQDAHGSPARVIFERDS